MLEGFPSSHPHSWTSQQQHRPLKADQNTSNLFVSLDFLADDSSDGSKLRGRIRDNYQHHQQASLIQRTKSQSSAFLDSPDLDSSSGSEHEWKRNFASDEDPIHKRALRSSSREPPGASPLPLFPPSRNRSLSTSRPSQRIIHPWATDTSSPLRQTVDCADSSGNARWPDIDSVEKRDTSHKPIPSIQANGLPTQAHPMSQNMSSSPGQNRSSMASSPPHLATMQEEAWDVHYPFQSNGADRSSNRNRSTSSAAALQQHSDRGTYQRGNSSDSFSRSISLWKGEYGGMSPGTYSSQSVFQENSPSISSSGGHSLPQSQHQQFQQQQSQWDRGRRSEYVGVTAFDTFSEEEEPRELGIGGTESRRHSIAADPASTTLIGQRRAIGFEVGRPHPSAASRTSSVGRPIANGLASAQGNSFPASSMFGGGGLAISEDDLGIDLHKLNLDFINQQGSTNTRIPSSNAAVKGAHAASMPMANNGHEIANFGRSPPLTNRIGRWPISAGFRDDDTATSWSDMISSPTTNSSGFNDNYQQPFSRSENLQDSFPKEQKTALSATAKAFNGSNTMAFANSNGVSASNHQSFASGPFSPTFVTRQPSQERSSDYVTLPSSKPFINSQFDRQPTTSTTAQQHGTPVLSTVNTLSDIAIASLVTLGPLAPASGGPSDGQGNLQELGKGVPLQILPRSTTLYIVEFKEGRTDLYFRQQQGHQDEIYKGDLVIVEADRGKDLGTVVNDSITVEQVQSFLTHQAELLQQHGVGIGDAPHPSALALNRMTRSINPKRLFSKAGPGETALLHAKTLDEEKALALCNTKVIQRGLPMTVVAAELQWDRRKLTYYFRSTQRVDFRDLVKELFRTYKTRIWLCHIDHSSNSNSSSNNTLPT